MIEISKLDDLRSMESHGTQPKWKIRGFWYKADDGNYEGLAESIASDMLQKSNFTEHFTAATYDPETIKYRKKEYQGCKSPDFLKNGDRLIEISELFRKFGRDEDLQTLRSASLQPEESLKRCSDTVTQLTGLDKFGQYLSWMLTFDAIVLNSDRHNSNICVVRTRDGFAYTPLFDHGRSFALGASSWETGEVGDILVKHIIDGAEPRLYASFPKQLMAAEALNPGHPLQIHYGTADLQTSLARSSSIYDDKILRRAELVVNLQMQRYEKYFINDIRQKRLENLAEKVHGVVKQPHTINILENGDIRLDVGNAPDKYFIITSSPDFAEINAFAKDGTPISIYDLFHQNAAAFDIYMTVYKTLNIVPEKDVNRQETEER